MRNEQLVVVDWTRSSARVGVYVESVHGWQLESDSSLPPRLVVKHEDGKPLSILSGEPAMEQSADADSLFFDHPARDLPSIEDPELQSLLLITFWRELGHSLVERGHLRSDKAAVGYLVPPYRFSQPLLERFRASCASERPLRLVGSVQEAASLVVGGLRSEVFHFEESGVASETPITVCCVVAVDEQTVDVVCFDYSKTAPALHRIVIRDFFQTDCAALSARLHDCDWLGAFSLMVIVEDSALPAADQAALNAPLQAIAAGVEFERLQSPIAAQLKFRGAAHIAFCAAGYSPDQQEYDVTHACHIGLQVNQQYFQPVITKDAWTQLTEFPYLAAQAFHLRGQAGNALRLNLYSGYSTRVSDAVPLGNAVLWQEDLVQLSNDVALTAAVRLDDRNTGEFLLGTMPENRTLRRQPFSLPGLVG